ncbi:MAG: nucleotidyltransferase domain-containing protein [Burkholderiales bacterium]|nr:nucleotidyltransferase domain-containing protein [Burkholderiales bacterium]
MTATSNGLSDLLFPAHTRRKALSILLLHPERRLHVREIARLAGSPAGTMVKELDRLHRAGLLLKTPVGNQVHFAANPDSPVFTELAALLKKTVGLVDVLVDALSSLKSRITFAFVFGSVARGTENERSDVDVIVVGDVDFQSVIHALYPAQNELQREINPKVFTIAEWHERTRARSSFITDIVAKPKIFLIGNEDALHAPG